MLRPSRRNPALRLRLAVKNTHPLHMDMDFSSFQHHSLLNDSVNFESNIDCDECCGETVNYEETEIQFRPELDVGTLVDTTLPESFKTDVKTIQEIPRWFKENYATQLSFSKYFFGARILGLNLSDKDLEKVEPIMEFLKHGRRRTTTGELIQERPSIPGDTRFDESMTNTVQMLVNTVFKTASYRFLESTCFQEICRINQVLTE
jgi:hypothetical protein